MSKILGISAGFHDAAVAMVESGRIAYAGHSERYSGLKNDPNLNREIMVAAGACDFVDEVAYYEKPWLKLARQLWCGQPAQLTTPQRLMKPLGVKAKKYSTHLHHRSHAAAGFQTSPFTRAIVVVVDAIGEWDTASIWLASYDQRTWHARYQPLWRVSYPHSLGLFYSAMTQKAGLVPNDEEYILMGMAAYGSPHSAPFLDPLLFDNSDVLRTTQNMHAGIDVEWLDYEAHIDIAAAAQQLLENKLSSIFKLAEQFGEEHAVADLVYMGGVALNCSANTRVISKFWDHVWIMPNPGDAGSALGAAALAYKSLLGWEHPYLGSAIGVHHPVDAIVTALRASSIVGVAAGRAEFGPRALGNRSLLADPRGPNIKARVNEIKQRQQFRPFAPIILEEHASAYFDMSRVPNQRSPYMQYVVPVRHPELFPAISHVDKSARVQTVSPNCGSEIRQVLEKWYDQTGCPMLLNTSLNVRGKPMVNTVADAIEFEEKYKTKVLIGVE